VFAKNKLDKNNFRFGPNTNKERLLAAGDQEMLVRGALETLYTYNGCTKIMHALVTLDLTD
jgi:hypothetical protein